MVVLLVTVGSVSANDGGGNISVDVNSSDILNDNNGINILNEEINSSSESSDNNTSSLVSDDVNSSVENTSKLALNTSDDSVPVTPTKTSSVSTKTQTSSVIGKTVTVANVINAAVSLKSYVLSKKVLPSSVSVGSYKLTVSQFSYLMSVAIQKIKAKMSTSTKLTIISVTNKSSTYSVSYTASLASCVSLAKAVSSACSSKKVAPAYVSLSSKKVDFRSYTYAFAKILSFYKSNKRLPNTCLIESKVFKSSTNNAITLANVLTAAQVFNNYVLSKHGLPKSLTVGTTTCNTTEFIYLMVSAIKNINAGKTSATYSVKKVSSPDKKRNSDWIKSTKVSKADYINLASNVLNFINNNGRASNYATLSNSKKADYTLYSMAFSGILTSYKSNKILPSAYIFDCSVFESYSLSSLLSKKVNTNITFYLTSDNIKDVSSDNSALNQLKNTLVSLGYNAVVVGVGPNQHNNAYSKGCYGSNSVLLCCFGGVDVGCIEEWTGELSNNWFPNIYGGANVLSVFYLNPYGSSANINDYVPTAWDANYGWALNNPAQYMESNGISYIQSGTVSDVCSILKSLF